MRGSVLWMAPSPGGVCHRGDLISPTSCCRVVGVCGVPGQGLPGALAQMGMLWALREVGRELGSDGPACRA